MALQRRIADKPHTLREGRRDGCIQRPTDCSMRHQQREMIGVAVSDAQLVAAVRKLQPMNCVEQTPETAQAAPTRMIHAPYAALSCSSSKLKLKSELSSETARMKTTGARNLLKPDSWPPMIRHAEVSTRLDHTPQREREALKSNARQAHPLACLIPLFQISANGRVLPSCWMSSSLL